MLTSFKRVLKTYVLPYKPFVRNKSIWDEEYSEGKWEHLNNKKDSMRYGIIVTYIRDKFNYSISILDLGCGIGILQGKLSGTYSHYTGIDLSDEAIRIAKEKEDEKTVFHSHDITNYTPKEKYDCIIFNESIYYLDKPIETLKKYKSFLKKDGIIIISMWDYKERNNKLWKKINSFLVKNTGVYLKFDSGKAWYIRFYRDVASFFLLLNSTVLDFCL